MPDYQSEISDNLLNRYLQELVLAMSRGEAQAINRQNFRGDHKKQTLYFSSPLFLLPLLFEPSVTVRSVYAKRPHENAEIATSLGRKK